MSSARVYGLDFIVPDSAIWFTRPQLIDLNGARSSCSGSFQVYGDHRIQEAVLSHVAGSSGRICAISQSRAHPDQLLFDADRIRELSGTKGGIYSGNLCFVPQGDPESHDTDEYVSKVAASIGLPYDHFDLGWEERAGGFVVTSPRRERMPLGEWRPDGALWPYSLDQRNIPLPAGPITNPLEYSIGASNKLLAYKLVARGLPDAVPAFLPAGLWLDAQKRGQKCSRRFANTELLVIKPVHALRGFGTVVVPHHVLPLVAAELGLAGNDASVADSAQLLALALLWSDAAELMALIQAYVPAAPVFHPETDLPHACIHRATVLSSDLAPPRCIDVNVVLAPKPLLGPQERDSLIVSASSARTIVRPNDRAYCDVAATAEAVITTFEAEIREFFKGCDTFEMLSREADFLASQIDANADIDFSGVWNQFRSDVTLRELMEMPRS